MVRIPNLGKLICGCSSALICCGPCLFRSVPVHRKKSYSTIPYLDVSNKKMKSLIKHISFKQQTRDLPLIPQSSWNNLVPIQKAAPRQMNYLITLIRLTLDKIRIIKRQKWRRIFTIIEE